MDLIKVWGLVVVVVVLFCDMMGFLVLVYVVWVFFLNGNVIYV